MLKMISLNNGYLNIHKPIDYSEQNINDNIGRLIAITDRGYIDSTLIPNNVLKSWTSNIIYYVDDIILYNNKLYRCIVEHTSLVSFELDNWIELTGFIDEEIIFNHMMSNVDTGVHGFPIATIEDETKVLSVDSTGRYALVDPMDLGLEILHIGPNAPYVYTPANYASVTQPILFDMEYYHPLGTANAGIKIDIFENNFEQGLRSVYTTDWLPPMIRRSLPFGLLNSAKWYVAHVQCRDISGRVSDSRIINFRSLPSNLRDIYFANFIRNIDMSERMDFGLSNYLFLNYMNMNDMLGSTYKPTSFEILSDHTAIFIPDDVTGLTYQDFILTEYNHYDSIPLIRYVTRFKDIDNQYHASHNVFKNIDLEQIKIDSLEANKDYILQIYRIDENGNSTLAEQNVKTFNIDHLRSNRITLSGLLNVNSTIPVYYFKNIPIDNVKHLGVETKPKAPTITNANVFTYVYPTDHVNIKGQEILNFTYEHENETNPVPQQRCMVRFKKDHNVYHASQEFFGTNTNILLNTNDLETNTVYTLEFFVIDENQHCNFTTISCTTMPDGQYNYTPSHYTNTNDDIYISSTGILSLNKGVR